MFILWWRFVSFKLIFYKSCRPDALMGFVSKVLIAVFNPVPHILLNSYGINEGEDLDLAAPTVQYMSSSFFPFAVFLD